MRTEVWSPLQNCAVWMGAWLYGLESTDSLLDALTDLGGCPQSHDGGRFSDVLARIRTSTSDIISRRGTSEPALRLLLSGPGDPPLLPAGTPAAAAAAASPTGAIVVLTNDPLVHLVLITESEGLAQRWTVVEETRPLPAPAWLSPGEADALLVQATNESADLIEREDYVKTQRRTVPHPRLVVGTLTDFYDTPGLPGCVPPRAAKLFARADRVAAIIETVTDRLHDHRFDPQLLRLWRHIRQARMAGVAYSLGEFARKSSA